MVYELWRTDSPFTMSAAFPTQQEAIAALRQTLAAQGPHFLLRFVLVRKDRRNRRANPSGQPINHFAATRPA